MNWGIVFNYSTCTIFVQDLSVGHQNVLMLSVNKRIVIMSHFRFLAENVYKRDIDVHYKENIDCNRNCVFKVWKVSSKIYNISGHACK